MTELGIPCWSDEREPLRVGSCGRVDNDWYEMEVVNPATDTPLPRGQTGEFVVRPRQPWTIMKGYVGMPQETVQAWRNLWFHTGDMGFVDEEGYVYFVERQSERIRRRAENISAFEIESAALQHACVQEAAAVGVASGYESDEDIKLAVVLSPATSLAPEALLGFLADRLPHHMVPRYIEFLDRLPRSSTGKIVRAQLKIQAVNAVLWDRKAAGIELQKFITARRD